MRALIFSLLAACLAMQSASSALAAPRRGQTAAEQSGGAQHVTILDGATGVVLDCEDCNTPMPPASMSKLMTILIVAERMRAGSIRPDTMFHVSENAWRHGAVSDGSHMFLELNSNVSVADLIRGVIVVSANDACIVLAEGISGSEEAFVAEMNRRAAELGLRTAHFRNATGLPDPEHVISSADLARLARFITIEHPELYRLYAQRTFTYNRHTQENRNPLLGAFTGADGVKTGHTDASGYGLIGSAVLNGQRRFIVFNGARSMAERNREAQRLMRAAFYDYDVIRLAEPNRPLGEAQVWLGARKTVSLVAPHGVAIGLAHAQRGAMRAHIVYEGPLRAPIAKGQVVAHLVVEGPPGFQRRQFPLQAGEKVGKANWFVRAWEGLMRTFAGAS